MRRFLTIFGAVLLGLCLAAGAHGQVITNPTTVEFTPSVDHDRLGLDGVTPIVTRYDLRIFLEGATAPFQIHDLGKPAPVSGIISVTNPSWFVSLAMNVRHVARVAAVGPTGEGVSAASNPFGVVGAPAAGGVPVVK